MTIKEATSNRLTVQEWLTLHGYEDVDEVADAYNFELQFEEAVFNSYEDVPALCKQDCEVEVDGYCKHGAPSIFLYCGWV